MYFAISDPHSFTGIMLYSLYYAGFEEDNPEHRVVICGDAFDRGLASKSMFSWLQKMFEQHRLIYVRGNHEDLMIDLIDDIRRMRRIGNHHVSNGTVSTLAQLVGCTEFDILGRTFDWKLFDEVADSLINFINTACVDFAEIGKTIFVHGWVPTKCDENQIICVDENWRNGDWKRARWENGQEMFHFGIVPEDVDTIVVGHWHTSYGWNKLKKETSTEWGPDAKFDTMIHEKDNKKIIALDACTVYTQKVNVVIFDEEGNLVK